MNNDIPQHNRSLYRTDEVKNFERLYAAFQNSNLSLAYKLQAFPLWVRRQDLAYFLAKYEIFKQVLHVNGSIVECGVFVGSGTLSWLHFSSMLEPYNHTRRIIGFDTFSGFPDIEEMDNKTGISEHLHTGGLGVAGDMQQELTEIIAAHDTNRPLSHIAKVELIKGDAVVTIPEYVKANPHLLISLLYLDFDIYKPTKVALQTLYKRVVKGGIVVFDEANCSQYPGETIAMLEELDMANVELKRFPFTTHLSYFVK